MSILSVTAQFFWEIELGREMAAELFTPPPKVDSQILILKRRSSPLFDVDSKAYFRVVKAGFAQKRKTLLNNLSVGLQKSREEIQQIGEQTGIDMGRRAQTLSLEEWHNLHETLNT
jgi:16S rRNA (adenine1518-N6/adenine1519-N6)-dimethyltransferase